MPSFKSDQVNLHYESTGQGEAIVFLHGFTGSHKDWRFQIDAVKDRYRTVALDLRGHGRSDAPVNESDYSIYHNCDDLKRLLDELGIQKCCLVGHSMGGFTALQFAVDCPDLLWALVLVDTSSGEWDMVPGMAELRAKLDELARTEGLDAAFAFDAENNPARIDRFKKQPEQREIARNKVLDTSVDGYVYVPRSFGKWQSVTARLGEIKVPTIIFRGEHDAGFVRPSDILKAAIPGSELVVVPGAYHNPHEESPEVFNEHFTKFLSGIK